MKKILLLGPFPVGKKGVNGQTIANQTLYEGLLSLYNVEKIKRNFQKVLDEWRISVIIHIAVTRERLSETA